MTTNLNDAGFWDSQSGYQRVPHNFTSFYAEQAWHLADVRSGARVLDIAAGAGALALVAARAGASVLATDFSFGMVSAILAHRLAGLEAEVMDGHALDLPDGGFDAAFSMFGIMLFADWRKGLAEMARVVHPGGIGVVGSWKEASGAASNLLLAEHLAKLFPEIVNPLTVEGMNEFRDPDRFRSAMMAAGFGSVAIHEVCQDYAVDQAALLEPDRLFQFSPIWPELSPSQRRQILASIQDQFVRAGGVVGVPSPAWIAIGERI